MNGVLVIDKPAGRSSAAVVARVKRALGARRVGHAGTLDPMATGVLVVCVGEGTKIAGYLLADDKEYEAEVELGVETDTLDADGAVTRRAPVRVQRARLEQALGALAARREQVPPMYSALKQGGRRLYALARAGVEVPRPPRPITIHALELLAFAPPRLRLRVACSKGTYVRALARDLGAELGCGAYLAALRRTRSGRFDLSAALALDALDPAAAAARLIDPADALDHLPAVAVPAARVAAVGNGQPLPWSDLAPGQPPPSEEFRLLTPEGRLLALARVEGGRARYLRVFTYGLT